MWNSTGVVGYIALLMTVGASLVSNGDTNAYATRADAFSARTRFENVIQETNSQESSRYVRISIDGVAYEGTVHVAR